MILSEMIPVDFNLYYSRTYYFVKINPITLTEQNAISSFSDKEYQKERVSTVYTCNTVSIEFLLGCKLDAILCIDNRL